MQSITGSRMVALDIITNKSALAIVAGVGYALATLLMKVASGSVSLIVLGAIVIVLCIVVAAEILLLRQVDLGIAYITVTATETLLVLAATFLIGETLSPKELFGGALVVLGVAMVSF
ncbi:5-aminolevulinate synthase [Marivita sp. GX14005]|uniref:5-aminolevulinate synthase n=1 Tax=Marivita sp. GX14005 TaxID=2942276 RepID=UPI0020189C7D|nr:5-aminolevulinate synthase [Marivita sp. GX14005]MCL3880992.1 5-aminolevulinate synthase [Marivita sp. GX14005]